MAIEQINEFQWVSLSAETRAKIREVFLIPRSSHARVTTDSMGRSTLETDGTTNEDLKSLSVEKMRDFVGSVAINETVYDLFRRVVEKVEEPTQGSSSTTIVGVPSTNLAEIAPQSELKGDSKVEDGVIKCEKCAFQSKSKVAIRMHIGKKHK